MEFTEHFNLAKLERDEGLHAGQYAQEDRDTLDALLQLALTHQHVGDINPNPAPEADLHGGGSLPAGRTIRYRYTILDPGEGELSASGEATVSTPSPLSAPPAPAAMVESSGGQLAPGEYSYTLTRYAGPSTSETTVLRSVEVTVPSATGQVTLTLPDYGWGASGFNVYRRSPGQDGYFHLATVATGPEFVDDGTLTETERALPDVNTTYADNAATLTLPITLEDGQQWRLYRSYETDFKDSLLGQFPHNVEVVVDEGQPTSPASLPRNLITPPSPSKVRLTEGAEVRGVLPHESLTLSEEYEHAPGETLGEILESLDAVAREASGGASAQFTGNGVDDTFTIQHDLGKYFQVEAWRLPGPSGGALLPATIASYQHSDVRPDSILSVTFDSPPADGQEVRVSLIRVEPPPPSIRFTYNSANMFNTRVVRLPLAGQIEGVVHWGDGTVEEVTSPLPTHTYATTGIYRPRFVGTFTHLSYQANHNSRSGLMSVDEWGETGTTSMQGAFTSCSRLTSVPQPPSTVTNMRNAFWSASNFNQDISGWNVSSVTDMGGMFTAATSFNQDISGWDVSNVTDMSDMFNSATAFNQDISGWDVSNVAAMDAMFRYASNFNQDLNDWDVSNVTSMYEMFRLNSGFNADISKWDVSNVIDMGYMFAAATAFNRDISGWDTSSVRWFTGMFQAATNFNQDLADWDTSSATSLAFLFSGSSTFTRGPAVDFDISKWDTSNVISMEGMFRFASDALSIGVSELDTSNVSRFDNMFESAANVNPDVSAWDTSSATVMGGMFSGATQFNQDISGWDVSEVYNFESMFRGATAFNSDISGWSVSNAVNMSHMFRDAKAFNADISGWDVSNCGYFDYMFGGAAEFNQDLDGWDMSWAWSINGMFWNTGAFNQDLNNWDVSNMGSMTSVFSSTKAFNGDISDWDVSNQTSLAHLFNGAEVFNQDISGWDVSNVTTFTNIFANTLAFDQDLSEWDTSSATTMEGAFQGSTYNRPLNSWDVGNVTVFRSMFRDSSFNQPLDEWDTSSATTMDGMFWGNRVFNEDITTWDVRRVTIFSYMFSGGWNFNQDISSWEPMAVQSIVYMFSGATSFNQDLSSWDFTHLGASNRSWWDNNTPAWVLPKPQV